jgi:hypothetical protein
MKLLTITWASCLFLSSQVFSESRDTEISNVKSIEITQHGDYKVKCDDGSKGMVSFEENDICVFYKKNRKNHCDSDTTWSVESSASFICDGHVIEEAPLINEEDGDND